jgi:hypothetical protein
MDDSSVVSSPVPKAANLRPTDPLVALVLFLVPLMLLAMALPPYRGNAGMAKQYWALGGAIAILAIAGAVWWRTRSTLPLILLGTAILLIAQIAWGMSFRKYTAHHPDYSREVFRRAMRLSLHAPVYGRFDNAFFRENPDTGRNEFNTLPFVFLSGLVAAGWYSWSLRRPWDRPWCKGALATLMGLQLAMIALFAACEPLPIRFSLNISGYSEFKKDLPAFKGVRQTLRTYVAKMPTLEWYGQHYPPGNLIALKIEKEVHLPGMTKALVCLCTVLVILPLWRLTRELEFDNAATSATLLLFAAGTGVLIYCTLNTTSLLLLPGTMCLWLLIRALKTGEVLPAIGLGASFVFYTFFSFSASILGVLMALTTIIGWWRGAFTLRNVIRTGIISLATVACLVATLYVTTHFNLIACFITAVRGHQAQQGNEGFDDAKRWMLRSTGNLIAYLFSIVPLCVLAVGAVMRDRTSAKPQAAKALFVALLVSVLIASFSGLFYIETERIWIFLTPIFALAAGWELSHRAQREGADLLTTVFLLVLVISCTQEWLFMHYR